TATRATVAKPAGSSKTGLVIGALVLVLVAAAAWYFIFNHDKVVAVRDIERTSPPAVPEGMALIPGGSFMMGRDLTDEEKKYWLGGRKKPVYSFSYQLPAPLVK